MTTVITCTFREWVNLVDGTTVDGPNITVKLEDVPGVDELCLPCMLAPQGSGWAMGMAIHRKRWGWESLGRPDINPRDYNALAACILRAEWPMVTFILPTEETK